jgi:hypothetical protein
MATKLTKAKAQPKRASAAKKTSPRRPSKSATGRSAAAKSQKSGAASKRAPKAAPAKVATKPAKTEKPAVKKATSQARPAAKAAKASAKGPARTTAVKKSGAKTTAARSAKKTIKKSATPSKPTSAKAKRTGSAKTAKRTAAKAAPAKTRATRKTAAVKGSSDLVKDFRRMVNLTPEQMKQWLSTSESIKFGLRDARRGEPAGHESGKRTLALIQKRADKLTEEDFKHMNTVLTYLRRRLEKRPKGDISASNWRYSMMNWGHDPLKPRRNSK